MSDAAVRTLPAESRAAPSEGDRYLALLGVVLLGYALIGKGFAYLGVPPFYLGEIALAAGLVIFLRIGAFAGVMATLPALLLVVLMVWVLARTIPFVGEYGFDSLRDSVVVIYGCFAFFVIALLLQDARRIATLLRYYGVMLMSLPVMLATFLLTKYWGDSVPRLFGPVPIIEVSGSTVGSHLAGAIIFVLVGFRKVSPLWILVWLLTLASVSATGRGPMLAVVVPVTVAMLLLGRFRLMLSTVLTAVVLFGTLLAFESTFGEYQEATESIERPVSAHQIVENAKSVIGQSGQQTEGTKVWRLNWWDIIINDTIHGPHFWTGRGFGINLALADGFAGTDYLLQGRPVTRSPHSVHMTMLARAGVPGLVLWVLVLVSWFAMMAKSFMVAKLRGEQQWSGLFLFIGCYVTAILINASFDVALEGPIQGIWFWCLFGFGIGSAMIFRVQRSHAFDGAMQTVGRLTRGAEQGHAHHA